MNPRRITLYAGAIVFAYSALLLYLAMTRAWVLGPDGTARQSDFLAFWAAAHLATAGHPAEAYIHDALRQVQ